MITVEGALGPTDTLDESKNRIAKKVDGLFDPPEAPDGFHLFGRTITVLNAGDRDWIPRGNDLFSVEPPGLVIYDSQGQQHNYKPNDHDALIYMEEVLGPDYPLGDGLTVGICLDKINRTLKTDWMETDEVVVTFSQADNRDSSGSAALHMQH